MSACVWPEFKAWLLYSTQELQAPDNERGPVVAPQGPACWNNLSHAVNIDFAKPVFTFEASWRNYKAIHFWFKTICFLEMECNIVKLTVYFRVFVWRSPPNKALIALYRSHFGHAKTAICALRMLNAGRDSFHCASVSVNPDLHSGWRLTPLFV